MMSTFHRQAAGCLAAFGALAFATIVTPGVSGAVECGWGTVYDGPSNSCVAAPAPPPPAPPPPAWNGDITPYFGVGVCVPIPVPFAPSICGGI
jgi:hypothetical protein